MRYEHPIHPPDCLPYKRLTCISKIIACGQNHVVAVDANGKIWTWGNGGYGRLGHKVQKDEFAPKMVDIQGGDRNVCPADCVVGASQTSSWVSALQGQVRADFCCRGYMLIQESYSAEPATFTLTR